MTAKATTTTGISERLAALEKLEAYFQKPDLDLEEALLKHAEANALVKGILSDLDRAESSLEQVDAASFAAAHDDFEPSES